MTEQFANALILANALHADQVYKTSGAPFIAHPMTVCALVLEDGGSETEAIAALFHDAAEDQGGAETLQIIRDRFGDEVADLVEECSEPYVRPRAPWRHRKDTYLAAISEASEGAVRIMTADKLNNAGRLPIEYARIGHDLWDKFVASREETIWFYEAAYDALELRRGRDDPMIIELDHAVKKLAAIGR
jgi:(p)ppGpp synthase/HD superfamily hydrolase